MEENNNVEEAKKTILIVDDEEPIINLLEYNLMNIFELYNEYHINLLFNFLSNNNDSIIKKIIEKRKKSYGKYIKNTL